MINLYVNLTMMFLIKIYYKDVSNVILNLTLQFLLYYIYNPNNNNVKLSSIMQERLRHIFLSLHGNLPPRWP